MTKTKKTVFIAGPITGLTENEYRVFRSNILDFVKTIEQKYTVLTEFKPIKSLRQVDSPKEASINDFKAIRDCDTFVFFHPKKAQSSSLIELGYAFALGKHIVVIGEENNLPYLAKGIIQQEDVDYYESSTLTANMISSF